MTLRKKLGISALAVLLAGVVTCSAIGIADYINSSSDYEDVNSVTNNVAFNTNDNGGISLTATTLTAQAGASYESVYEITATVVPEDAYDTSISLSLVWADSSASWVTDNKAQLSDYVSLSSATLNSGDSVTLYCYQSFGEQMILIATANGAAEGTTVSSSCTLDYVYRLSGSHVYAEDWCEDTLFGAYSTEYDNYATINTVINYSDFNGFDDMTYDVSYLNLYFDTTGNGTVYEDLKKVNVGFKSLLSDGTSASGYYADEISLGGSYNAATLIDYIYSNNSGYSEAFEVYSVLGEIIYKLYGYDMYDMTNSDANAVYDILQDHYESGTAIIAFYVTATGATTGIDYSYVMPMLINPAGLAVSVNSISFSTESIAL
ncbi:MAG: hypothetical protein LUI60_08055 [Clostridia bacterium]|nr:hypothetical protein [Clostridia bacterium]